ncbi:MAG: hypothetical protein KIT46_04500 [Anaerolineales bacterium]|nr:hypothetical protein [Anaerolineales bacterium]MCW5855290.1 hypothetical protein [Anaerolineales bacterium]
MRIEILNGYRGRRSNEFYLAPGMVVEAGEEDAKHLIETGHAAPSSRKATYSLKRGPLRKGEGRPEPDEIAQDRAEKILSVRESELARMSKDQLRQLLAELGVQPGPIARFNHKSLVAEVLKAEAADTAVAVETEVVEE